MDDVGGDAQLRLLTAEMAWVRRLAHALMQGEDSDDLAQDAWLVAAEHAPTDGRPLRPWLARVLLNLVRMRSRSGKRRDARHAKSADLALPAALPDELVERVELQQLIAGEVLALAEPYRSTVLLHFFEELTCAEIARRLELPEGTVRRRLKVALDELRAQLASNTRSRGGLAALAPLAGLHKPVLGVIAMKKIIAAVVVLLLLILGGVLWKRRGEPAHKAGSEIAGTGTGSVGTPAGGGDSAQVAPDGVPAWLAQQAAKPRRIAGRVTFRGAPVAGALVDLASVASESGLVPAPRRTTNAAGEFDFGLQRAMEWSVRASAAHKASARQDLDLRNPAAAPPPDRLELELGSCDAAIVGTVRDASGGTIAKARLSQLTSGHTSVPGGPGVTTDDAGAYELCFVPRWPLWYGVEVSADGYATITFSTIAPGRIKVDFALVPEATIVGRVVRDDTGASVPQAYVYVPPGPPGIESTPLHGTFTDANGHFQLARMSAGRHLVFARADGLAESAHGTPTVVGVGQTGVEIEIRLEAGSTIRGTVMDHGKPVAGARVAALDGSRKTATAVSQEDGTFALGGVPHGEVRFIAPPYDVLSPKSFLVAQPVHEGVTLEVESLGTIIGHVVRNKLPVPGATIDIHGPNDRDLEPIVADAAGRFEARGLAAGPWALAASDDRVGAFGILPDPVQIGRGETKEVTIDIAYAASISGKVVDQTGAPVPSVLVIFRSTKSDDTGMTATAEDGAYRAASMTGGGEYRPIVKRTMRSTAVIPPATGTEFPIVALSDGDSEVTGIVLTVRLDHLSLAGRVVDSDGAPVADARVVAELVEGNDLGRFRSGAQDPADTTNVDGQFSIDDLLGGVYAIRARSPSGVEATLMGIRAGRTDLTLVVPTAGGIEVTAAAFQTPPQVTASRGGAPVVASPQGAIFALKNLSPGSYTVVARTSTEAASAIVEVAAGKTSRVTLTSAGSAVIAGHVHELRTGKPVEGMTCRALPRIGTEAAAFPPSEGARTDAQGAFLISAAPAGPITLSCDGLWHTYSDGVRLLTLQPAQRTDVDVRVVEILGQGGASIILGGFGADMDQRVLVPRLWHVQPGGPAAVAGLSEGDLVSTVNGTSVTELSPRGTWVFIVNRATGAKVKIGVTRGTKAITGEVTLGEAPQ